MTKAVILDYDSLAPADLDLGKLWQLPVDWQCFGTTHPEQLDERLNGAIIVLNNKVKIERRHLQDHPSIKLIMIMATGTNNVDLAAAKKLGVSVCNIVNYSTHSVVQHTISAMLALATNIIDYNRDARNGTWSDSPFFCLLNHPITELHGKTIGIIGYGAIGKGVAQVAAALGMKVLVAASLTGHCNAGDALNRTPLSELLRSVDVLSLHCPLSEYSRKLIDKKALQSMKAGAWILNMSRGGILVETDLIEQLRNGHIGAAALDTIEEEPPGRDNPLLADDIPNLILSPHSAWGSQASRQCLVDQLVTILGNYLNGEPLTNQIC